MGCIRGERVDLLLGVGLDVVTHRLESEREIERVNGGGGRERGEGDARQEVIDSLTDGGLTGTLGDDELRVARGRKGWEGCCETS